VIKIVVLQLPEDEQTLLTADGQEMIPLKAEDEVLIQRSEHTTRFIRLKHYRFFEILRSKLGWSA
jgi:NAD+ kinase